MSSSSDNELQFKLCKRIEGNIFAFEAEDQQLPDESNDSKDKIVTATKESVKDDILNCVKASVYNVCIHDEFRSLLNWKMKECVDDLRLNTNSMDSLKDVPMGSTTDDKINAEKIMNDKINNDGEINDKNNNEIKNNKMNNKNINDVNNKLSNNSITTQHTPQTIEPPKKLKLIETPPVIQSQLNDKRITDTNLKQSRVVYISLTDAQKSELYHKMQYLIDEEDLNYIKMAYDQLTLKESNRCQDKNSNQSNDDYYIDLKAKEWNMTKEELIDARDLFKQFEWVEKDIPKLPKTEDFIKETYVRMLFEASLSLETKVKMKKTFSPALMAGGETLLYKFLCASDSMVAPSANGMLTKKCTRLKTYFELREEKKSRSTNKNYRNEAATQIVKFLLAQRSTLKSNSVVTANNKFTQLTSYGTHKSKTRKSTKTNYQADHSVQSRYYSMKATKTNLVFSKSTIHNWGLFATDQIPKNEMIVEYTGEIIRNSVADHREHCSGPDASSYFFRLDSEWVIDATNCGNYARFINHSCDPNCYAEIVEIDNAGKIIIFSKREIQAGEELTYDYNFPLEDVKIPCCCGASNCRGTLN